MARTTTRSGSSRSIRATPAGRLAATVLVAASAGTPGRRPLGHHARLAARKPLAVTARQGRVGTVDDDLAIDHEGAREGASALWYTRPSGPSYTTRSAGARTTSSRGC